MPAITEFPCSIREIENEWIGLADGTRLAARIWMPDDAVFSPVPAVLECVPYRKRDRMAERDALIHPWFAGHGYAALRVDVRGSGESDGILTDEYLQLEQDDALEVIAWIARQPWCSGAVGMMGNSWGGFNALQVAARRPPALRAIITSCSTDDRYADDIHYMGGCLLNDNMKWGSTMFAYNTRPPDPALVGDRWRELWLQRLDGSGLWIDTWLRHQRRDAFWKHGSVCEDYAAIEVPVFAIGGWQDGYTNAVPRLLAGLRVPRLGWIGQWGHRYPHMAEPKPAVGFLQEATRWWDHWLKGIDTGMMDGPMLRAFMQEPVRPLAWHAAIPGRWVAETTWPSQRIETRRLFLGAGRLEAAAGSERALTIRSPHDVGLDCGRWSAHCSGPDLPTDQRRDDAYSLVFDSDPMKRWLELLGAPVVEMELSADRPQAMIALRLNRIAPDGTVSRFSYGLLNLSHRDSHEHPSPLVPGQRFRVRLPLKVIGQAIDPGDRLRLAISTSYWPLAWPSPETASVTVYTGASALELPLREPNEADAHAGLPPAVLPPRLRVTPVVPASESRSIARDVASGETSVDVSDVQGTKRYEDIGLMAGASQKQRYTIHAEDPNSARSEIDWTVGMARVGWNIETRTRSVMTSTPHEFRVRASLDAFEDGRRVFSRDWDCRIPRDNI